MKKVKFCGIRTAEDVASLAPLAVDYVGLVFHEESPRSVSIADAKELSSLIKAAGKTPVAVFVDQSAAEMQDIMDACGIDVVQLHGDRSRAEQGKFAKGITRIFALSVDQAGVVMQADLSALDTKRDYVLFDGVVAGSGERIVTNQLDQAAQGFRYFLAGGINPSNVGEIADNSLAAVIDVSSGIESTRGVKSERLMQQFINRLYHGGIEDRRQTQFGEFGGIYMPESLMAAIEQVAIAFQDMLTDSDFQRQLAELFHHYSGRETPLTEVVRFSQAAGGKGRLFLKREDLLHTGAHKINNALGQCLLAKKMGKTRIIAETGAGQHGVATATACAHLGLECVIYMGQDDIARQMPNVQKIRLLGAEVVPVETGSKTLKDAVNAALRDYAASFADTHYCLGSALGPYPFPQMVAYFQSCIGKETKIQVQERVGRDPDLLIACVGGGSNAIGLFGPFIDHDNVKMVGVEAGGNGKQLGEHAARFNGGEKGVLHGCFSYVLQDKNGQVAGTHSISAGLDYPMIGPQHAQLHDSGRAEYVSVSDDEALAALRLLSKTEGIIPALESSHALAYYMRITNTLSEDACVVINLSGRGDKDLPSLIEKGLLS
jgi:phosphoribosylanthranilate isomerase